jgi:hypothetical protein
MDLMERFSRSYRRKFAVLIEQLNRPGGDGGSRLGAALHRGRGHDAGVALAGGEQLARADARTDAPGGVTDLFN